MYLHISIHVTSLGVVSVTPWCIWKLCFILLYFCAILYIHTYALLLLPAYVICFNPALLICAWLLLYRYRYISFTPALITFRGLGKTLGSKNNYQVQCFSLALASFKQTNISTSIYMYVCVCILFMLLYSCSTSYIAIYALLLLHSYVHNMYTYAFLLHSYIYLCR